ncbi:MAG: serine/threonine protein kinase [Polyangiaceae bacterium]|nr:serine/threonine protein kinase [Polyangiaceae bacterium]
MKRREYLEMLAKPSPTTIPMSDAHTQEIDPLIGQLVASRYRVIKQLGEGGMGQVYLAEHEAIEKKIALKVLRPEYTAKEDIVTRFQQEAISASRIKHPNVLDVFDFGKLDNGAAFLAMEFLKGNDVADELIEKGALPPERCIHILTQICRALAAAHEAGVVHRDMKPDNVFLQRTGDGEEIVKIVDFGIAQLKSNEEPETPGGPKRRRLTKTGMIFGTPEYMAPEQAAGKKADLRVDVYACGIILYEMLTCCVPFTGETFMAVLAAHLNDPPPPMVQMKTDLQISAELTAVVERALVKSPDERFQNMAEFAAALLDTPEGLNLRSGRERFSSSHSIVPSTTNFSAHSVTAAVDAQTISGSTQNISRSDTPLDASGTVPGQAGPSKSLVLGSLAAVGLVGSVGSYLVYTLAIAAPAEEATPSGELSAELAPTPSVGPPVVAPVKEPKIEPAPTVATRIKLSVETEPPGATLSKNGFQVCDTTPCEVEADPKEQLELEAKLGNKVGHAKVLAQKDQTVRITLVGPKPTKRPRPTAPHPTAKPKQTAMCEVDVGGLKILRPCQ